MNFSRLAAFLAGYLHQDWDVDYESPIEAADAFARSEPNDLVLASLDELDELLRVDMTDAELRQWLLEVGCYYSPTGSAAAWLSGLGTRMRQQG